MKTQNPTFSIQHLGSKVIALIVIMLWCLHSSNAQRILKRELAVENDNDAYTLNLTRDQYYSNGVAARYRVLKDSSRWKNTMEKVIRTYNINHRIFSPKHLFWTDTSEMDRPYAGQISLSASNEYYFKNHSYIKAEVELGWMGPSLRIGQLQYEWHKTFGMTLPQGWRFQINDAPIINVWGRYARTLSAFKSGDIIAESNLTAGTAFGYARQEVLFRFGTIKSIKESTLFNGVLGIVNDGPKQHEIYFFISPGIEYVFFNSTIEGSFAGKESVFTEPLVTWVYQTRAGFMMSWTKFDFALMYYRRTKETPESTFHKYIGIRMNQRF